MQIIWRIGPTDIHHGKDRRPVGQGPEMHTRTFRRSAAFPQVARRTGGGNIIPGCLPPHAPGNHMVKGQFPTTTGDITTILTGEAVTQEQVKAGEIGMGSGGNIFFQGNDAGQPDFR